MVPRCALHTAGAHGQGKTAMTKEQAEAERARLRDQDMRIATNRMDMRAYREMVNAIAEGKPWPPENHDAEYIAALKAEPVTAARSFSV